MKNLILIFAIIAASSFAAFSQADRINDIQWTLTDANGKAVTNSSAYFEIDTAHTKFTGNTGCNRMFGAISLRGKLITFSNVGTTKMMCKLPAGSLPENAFLSGLNKTARYAVEGNTLNLFDRRGRTVLRFKRLVKQAPEETPTIDIKLDDRKWMLESVGNRKTLVAIEGVFVNFDAQKKSAGGNAGCNVFGGDYSAARSTMKIDQVISTMRACTNDGKMDLEREFLDGLRQADRYEIKDGKLFLYDGKKLLLTLRGEAKS